jgi:hypothetical protein
MKIGMANGERRIITRHAGGANKEEEEQKNREQRRIQTPRADPLVVGLMKR